MLGLKLIAFADALEHGHRSCLKLTIQLLHEQPRKSGWCRPTVLLRGPGWGIALDKRSQSLRLLPFLTRQSKQSAD